MRFNYFYMFSFAKLILLVEILFSGITKLHTALGCHLLYFVHVKHGLCFSKVGFYFFGFSIFSLKLLCQSVFDIHDYF